MSPSLWISFDDVPVFLAVVREGGVRGAARVLGLGASAVSKALTRLETRLGTRLLDRSARGVAP
ncbi:MAG: LysR family transcriptional regulator [Sandaracinus sp.]|nr:LysR family transcriptional regulator [Sandaracinus sp.]